MKSALKHWAFFPPDIFLAVDFGLMTDLLELGKVR
jgi:hypothetical protein